MCRFTVAAEVVLRLADGTRVRTERCRLLGDRDLQEPMTTIDQPTFMRNAPLGRWHQVWPPAVLAVAIVANLAWIGFLAYAAYNLAMLM